MDNAEEEKIKLLESIRLQDAALSVTVDNSLIYLESDSDSDELDLQFIDGDKSQSNKGISNEENFIVGQDETNSSQIIKKEASWAEALEANQEYDAVLAQLETEIKLNISKVSRLLSDVQSQISSVSTEGKAMNIKSHWLYVFGMPYFKDKDFFPCPSNEDLHTKKSNNEICWSDLPSFHQWVSRQKRALNHAVRKLSLEKCEEEARLKLAKLRKERDTAIETGNSERAVALEKSINLFDMDAYAQSLVDDVIENGEHDWMKISAKFLEGKQTAETCQSFWYLYLHPKINKSPFTEAEETNLVELVEKYKHQDWDSIAKELGTNRSGYQCFIVYQNKLVPKLRKSNWDREEDSKLLQVVEKCRIGDYIPWGKVAYHMEGRTKTQVFNRWTYSVNPVIRKGRFTQEEDIMILVGVQMWGEDFQRIASFLKDRTTCQVRDRFKNYLGRPVMGIPWTTEDDQLLFDLVEKYGKSWAEIAKHFPLKDRTQVRHRYSTVKRWRAKNPNAPLSAVPSRVFAATSAKVLSAEWERAKAILGCKSMDEMVNAKNNLVSTLVKRKRLLLDPPKKKKPSVVEMDLVNYFRCSFDIPGGWKMQMRSGESQKFAEELSMLVDLLNVNLNLPSVDEILADEDMNPIDKEILTAYILGKKQAEEVDQESPELFADQNSSEETETAQAPVFCDVKPSFQLPEIATDIDYIPKHDLTSLYIDLPLMNFDQDEVVADRNQDPSFFEAPVSEPIVDHEESDRPLNSHIEEKYMFPPNLTTLVGLRTYLLNRRPLLAWSTVPQTEHVDECRVKSDEFLYEARKKFDERILSLFMWPALMSRFAPSPGTSIFLDDEDEIQPNKIRHITDDGNNEISVFRLQQTTSVPGEGETVEVQCVDVRTSTQPPAKKRKVCSDRSGAVRPLEIVELDNTSTPGPSRTRLNDQLGHECEDP